MRHRTFHPLKFCSVVEPVQLQRFLESFGVPSQTAIRLVFDDEAFQAFCDRRDDHPTGAELTETLQRINDLAEASLRFVVNEYQRAEIPFNANDTPEQLAIRLYLDHRAAFEAAWSSYVLFGTSASLASYRLCPDLAITDSAIAGFAESVRTHFAMQAKGEECQVLRSDSDSGVVIRVDHGTHLHTQQHWLDGRITWTTLRPAKQDVLLYETRTGLLHIRASLDGDRDAYLRLFAEDIAGDGKLVAAAGGRPLYTLLPLRTGTFSFDGNGGEVLAVQLRQIRMRLYGSTDTVVTIGSRDVWSSLAEELAPLSLTAGDLLEARLRFHVWPKNGRAARVTLTIRPPARTALTQAKYSEIVERYLEAQGVRIQ